MSPTGQDANTPIGAHLPHQLALFPLRDAVLLPRGRLPLNIFEPRYLAMIDDALRTSRMVGLIRPRHDDVVNPPLYDIGCAGRITTFSEADDGRYLITLTGISRFRLVEEEIAVGGFRRGDVDWSAFTMDQNEVADDATAQRDQLVHLLSKYLDEVGMSADWDSMDGAPAEAIVNSIAMSCPFDADEKQALLEAPTVQERIDTLIALMEMSIISGRGEMGDDTGYRVQ